MMAEALQQKMMDNFNTLLDILNSKSKACRSLNLTKCDDIKIEITDISEHIFELENELKSLKNELVLEKEQLKKGKKEITNLKEEKHQKQVYLAEVIKTNTLLERDYIHFSGKESFLSAKDVSILNSHQKKLQIYKQITGIYWDYANIKTICAGYVQNKTRKYIHPFSFKKHDIVSLWKEIENACIVDWSDIGIVNRIETLDTDV